MGLPTAWLQTLLSAAGEWIASGSMKQILHPWAMDLELAIEANPEVSAKLVALSQLWDSSPAKFNATDVEALNETLALIHEAHGLITSSYRGFEVDIISVALAWPIRVPEAFLAIVNQQRPEALILFAHYSLLLNHVDQVWFMHGISKHLLQTIHSRIGKEWESWIAWLF